MKQGISRENIFLEFFAPALCRGFGIWLLFCLMLAPCPLPAADQKTAPRPTGSPLSEDEWYARAYKYLENSKPGTGKIQLPIISSPTLYSSSLKPGMIALISDPGNDMLWFGWLEDPEIWKVRLEVYEITGERLASIYQSGSDNWIGWSMGDINGGIYYYQISFWKSSRPIVGPLRKFVIFR